MNKIVCCSMLVFSLSVNLFAGTIEDQAWTQGALFPLSPSADISMISLVSQLIVIKSSIITYSYVFVNNSPTNVTLKVGIPTKYEPAVISESKQIATKLNETNFIWNNQILFQKYYEFEIVLEPNKKTEINIASSVRITNFNLSVSKLWNGNPGKTELILYWESPSREDMYTYISLIDSSSISTSTKFSVSPHIKELSAPYTLKYSWNFDSLDEVCDIKVLNNVTRSTNADPRLLQIIIAMQENKLLRTPIPQDSYCYNRTKDKIIEINNAAFLKTRLSSLNIDQTIPSLFTMTEQEIHDFLGILRTSIFLAYKEYPKKLDSIGFFYELYNLCRFYRNAVYALYNYNFEITEWKKLFTKFPWYKPQTKSPSLPSAYIKSIEGILSIEEQLELFLTNIQDYRVY